MSGTDGQTQLTPDRAARILARLRDELGLPDGPTPLLGPIADNAVLALPRAGMVARMSPASTGAGRLDREVRIARWAAANGLPTVRVAEKVARQPLVRSGVAVTFWVEVPDPQQAEPSEIGEALRSLHAVRPPDDGTLGRIEPFVRQEDHIAEATSLDADERAFLTSRLNELMSAYETLPFGPEVVVHGDPHRKNIVRAADGEVVILDLERCGIGPREWDLTVPAVYRRVGWYDADQYRSFVDAYGFDVTTWDGFTTMAAIRELRMTLWLASRASREPRLLPEVRRRIGSLRDDSAPRDWTPGT